MRQSSAQTVEAAVFTDSLPAASRPILNPLNYLAFIYFGALIVALLVFGSSPWIYGAFAICAVFFILPYHYLSGLSAIIVLTMFFERYFALQGLVLDRQTYKFYLLDIIICLTFLAWFLALIIKKRARGSRLKSLKQLGWPEYLLMLWLTLVAVWMLRSFGDINADFAVAFSSFKNYFFYPLVYLLFAFAITTHEDLRDLMHLLLYAATGLLVFLAIGVINGVGLWTEFTPLSSAGVRYLAGTHAFYLCLAFVIAAALLAYRRFRQPLLALAVMSLWSLGILFSLMRHLYLALFVGLAAVFILCGKQQRSLFSRYAKNAGLIAAAGILFIILFSSLTFYTSSPQSSVGLSSLTNRLSTFANLGEDSSATWRAQLWSIAKDEWQKNPFLGSGFGHTVLIETVDYQNFEELRNLHNSPLAITVQMGLIGAAAFAALVLSVLFSGYQALRRQSDPYLVGLLAAAAVFLVACCFQPYLETNMMGIWLWIILGLIRAASLLIGNKAGHNR